MNKFLSSKMMLVIVVLMLSALLVPGVMAQDEDTIVIAPGDDVVLGLATALSGEGLIPFGEDIQRGAQLALLDRPTVTVGDVEFTVGELVSQDDQCSSEGGQAVANLFTSSPEIVAVIGPMCSSACNAAGPIFDEAEYAYISSSCTAVSLTDEEEGFDTFSRTTPNDDAQSVAAADFIYNELGITMIATIHDGSDYGDGLVSAVTALFEELGGEVVFADAVNVGDTDFRSLLDNVAETDAELIYFGGFNQEGARLAEQRVDAGLEDVVFMGADGIFGPEFINLAGDFAEGVYASSPIPTSEAYTDFVARYEEVFGLEPTAAFHAYAYDAANMLLDGVEAVGEIDADGNLAISRSALLEFIRAYGAEEPVLGLSGELSCDGTGECALGGFNFYEVIDGDYTLVEMMMEEE